MGLEAKAQTSMDFLSKKMGAAGIFIGWVLFVCVAPDKIRVLLSAVIAVLFIVITIWRKYIKAKYDPAGAVGAKTILGRMSAPMVMAGGYVSALLASSIGMEWKMYGGFVVVVIFLLAQGVYDTLLAKLGIETIPVGNITSVNGSKKQPKPTLPPNLGQSAE